MMAAWVRFGFSAFFAAVGVFAFISGAVGAFRLDYVLSRMHATALADTVGIGAIAISASIAAGVDFVTLKLLFSAAAMVLTSPVSTHMLAELEYRTGDELYKHVKFKVGKKWERLK